MQFDDEGLQIICFWNGIDYYEFKQLLDIRGIFHLFSFFENFQFKFPKVQ